MYTKEIISLLMWPVLILAAYLISLAALRHFDKQEDKTNVEAEEK
ncbi:MAG TPA: hypothetical protein PLP11_06410 [Bacteroidales bacterium]|nr:hypothetical protein [Bacteroidales bacterium]HQP04217.1 hypothetical protein [Bacteroidales bacterium]